MIDTTKPTSTTLGGKPVDAQTFGSTMGNAVWLMTMDPAYKDRAIREVEQIVATPILLRNFKLYSKANQPVAFLSWAAVSPEAKAKLNAGELLELKDWRSGNEIVVVDCVSPFNPAATFVEKFMESVKQAKGAAPN